MAVIRKKEKKTVLNINTILFSGFSAKFKSALYKLTSESEVNLFDPNCTRIQ